MTDALGAVTSSSYDPLGRQVATTNPISGTSITTYNATEQVSAQDPQGHATTESHDATGRLIQASATLPYFMFMRPLCHVDERCNQYREMR